MILAAADAMTPQETFVTRLRRHRQRNRLTLEDIAAEMRVSRDLLEALENNDLSAWPGGLYARAWIRSYAAIVGLDPDDTVDEFCRLFPEGDRRIRPTIEEIAAIVATTPRYHDGFDPREDRRKASQAAADPEPPLEAAVHQIRTRGRHAGDVLAEVIRAFRVRVAASRHE